MLLLKEGNQLVKLKQGDYVNITSHSRIELNKLIKEKKLLGWQLTINSTFNLYAIKALNNRYKIRFYGFKIIIGCDL